ncbi:MAG: DNA mismatch repair endonuclease MutL [Candidatus Neomarinimicrobiota bacterium]
MGHIRILPDELKNKIAAGEVVERPASIAKELIENSIDAGATQIEITVAGGGNVSVQVVDNGDGLDREDLELAFSRYATSKIVNFEDLRRIDTLGFRGEALASIASVAKVRTISTADGSGEGHELVVTDGVPSEPVPFPAPGGTSVTVSDLFFSVPARRKFLKSPQVEFRHIVRTVRRFALSYPQIAFRLMSDKKEIMDLQSENLEERIGKVFDPTYRKSILPVQFEKEPFRVHGFVGNLNLVRKRRGEQFLFLNGRYIVNPLMNSAVYSAYRSLISRGEFPFFVLHLDVPRDQVDVNVHPVKIEVRFRDEWRIYHVLKTAATEAISDILKTIPDFSPRDIQASQQSELRLERSGAQARSSFQMEPVERAKEYIRSFSTRKADDERVGLESIWQVHRKYIVSEIKSGLVIIDQHVAHERVLFEQALRAMEGSSMSSQVLLFPEVVELPPDDYAVLMDLLSYLNKIGFRMKEFGKNTVLIEAVPSEMGWGNEKKILKEIIDDYRGHHKEYNSHREGLAASFSCRAAVKAGDRLTVEEMQTLIDRLFATEHPYYCPHGRPIIVNLSLDELDRRFERS